MYGTARSNKDSPLCGFVWTPLYVIFLMHLWTSWLLLCFDLHVNISEGHVTTCSYAVCIMITEVNQTTGPSFIRLYCHPNLHLHLLVPFAPTALLLSSTWRVNTTGGYLKLPPTTRSHHGKSVPAPRMWPGPTFLALWSPPVSGSFALRRHTQEGKHSCSRWVLSKKPTYSLLMVWLIQAIIL